MVTHMKTTIDIADDLLRRAKEAAARRKTTLRALMEEGLRRVLDRDQVGATRRITIRSVDGNGLTKEAREMSWQEIMDLANERPRDWD